MLGGIIDRGYENFLSIGDEGSRIAIIAYIHLHRIIEGLKVSGEVQVEENPDNTNIITFKFNGRNISISYVLNLADKTINIDEINYAITYDSDGRYYLSPIEV